MTVRKKSVETCNTVVKLVPLPPIFDLSVFYLRSVKFYPVCFYVTVMSTPIRNQRINNNNNNNKL